jgi:hypothetical protein
MTDPTDWRALCAELVNELHTYKVANEQHEDALVNCARTALAQPEPQGSATLIWSEERQPCEECRYNHCIAETPFGRFLISWKGWKDYPAVTVDEAPFGEWFECWNSVEKAKSACQAEYNRRLAAAVGSLPCQPEPQGPSDEELLELLSRASGLPEPDSYIVDGGRIMSEPCEILSFARAALARWGRPAIEPVPVTERLPGPEDCDAEGRCWLCGKVEGDWRLLNSANSGVPQLKYCFSHWLPHWALPVPGRSSD